MAYVPGPRCHLTREVPVKRATVLTSSAVALLLMAGGATTATALHKDVTVTVDGQASRVGAFGFTVADVLSAQGITLGERDLVYPSLSDSVADGQTITVEYSRPVSLTVDGSPVTFHTTATSLAAALEEINQPGLRSARLSAARSAALPREGLSIEATTAKDVTLIVAGKKKNLSTTAATVEDLLTEQGITRDSDDRVKPELDAGVTDGLRIVVDRVEVSTLTKKESVPHAVVVRKDASAWKGESSVLTRGKDGTAQRSYLVTTVNGKVESTRKTSEKLLTKPVAEVRTVGTKASASGIGLNLARAAMWDKIARCESGNNWSINTGNGYYGGLQFNLASWRSNGGRDFAAYPHQASRAEQITVANRYYAKAGTSPWTCA